MTKQKKQFSPHIYAEWGELFEILDDRQKGEILMGIVKFPNYEPKDVPIWNFIKSQLKKDYEIFIDKCNKNGEISRNYWQNKKPNDIERLPNDTKRHPKLITNNELQITNNKITNNKLQITNNIELLGEFKNVKLSKEEIEKVKNIYNEKFSDAIELLSNYIASSGRKYKSHYAVLGKHNWVYSEIFKNSKSSQKLDISKMTDEELYNMVF